MTQLIDFFGFNKSYLIECLVRRNLKLKYRRSSLGFLWSLFVPLLTSMTYLLLLKFIMRFDVPHYAFMLVMGTITWTFFVISSNDGMQSIGGNYALASKVPVNFNNFILATTLTAFINHLLSIPIIVGFGLLDGLTISVSYLALPVIWFLFLLFAYCFAVILGILTVYFRDLEHLFGVVLQLWMYATPILYPPSMMPEHLKWLFYLNPVAPFFISLQDIFIHARWPDPTMLAVACGWVSLAFVTAYLLFKHVRYTVLENV